ncbi:hydantoinase/oxoprolinase family protein [Oceanibacterium hippocampi]|uniref:Acetophenone carboxylase gamma subunit n=1 Tax=Oceanibacterium hippocampi TaxID=745714 RepID=A0A1Y5TY80_9PROT|nr:hydantoinase/oxoprolinase family protein [Oceanibacterium hippocampi]SLN75659.1 Acetophenone carboxylase gamma subunit [Oceanibacterium hippocampi]
MSKTYRIGIDIGGTFTDIALVDDEGTVEIRKVASTPDDYSRGIALGLKAIIDDFGIDPGRVAGIVHATTVATNTILEFKGAVTGLITTAGFRDVLEIRRLRIPVLYDLQYDKPQPLVPRRLRLEARERLRPDGSVKTPLNEDDVARAAEVFRREKVEAVAISYLHAYANQAHEIRTEEILRDALGDGVYICRGAEILPEIREYERTSTAVVNAYVGPVIRNYADALAGRLAEIGIDAPIEMMHSGGGIMRLAASVRRAAALVESGPAAGVIACARLVRGEGRGANIISFDMGGTTAKAALIENGAAARTDEYEVGAGINLSSKLVKGGGYPIKMPFIDVSEIGAGGGSIVSLDSLGRVAVGPESAGSMPGPVCYGRGGTQATLTDVFVTLGYINDVTLAGGSIEVDAEAGRAALRQQISDPLGQDLAVAARGILMLAVSTMTRAVKAVSTYRGRDPRDFSLIAFGGNGPVVAADIASALGIQHIIVPLAAGVFSGFGLLRSDVEQEFVQPLLVDTKQMPADMLPGIKARLRDRAMDALRADGYDTGLADYHFSADLRYFGQAYELNIPGDMNGGDIGALEEGFHCEHERTNGHRSTTDPVQLVNARLSVTVPMASKIARFAPAPRFERTDRPVNFGEGPVMTAVVGREALKSSYRPGPFIIEDYDCTCVVPPNASARLDALGNIEIEVTPA